MDGRPLYGATGSTAEAALTQPAPKSMSQAAAPFVAEFVGTFVLVLTVGCCLMSPGDPAWNATAISCGLMVMVYCTGPVSGGNLNPAVSLTLGLIGSLEWATVLGYWAAQLAGGLGAGCCFCALFGQKKAQLEREPPFSWQYAAAAEFIYTCVLCFVFANCMVSRRNNPPDDANQFYGLAIGFVVLAGGYAAGGIAGACFNPAVALGLGVSVAPGHGEGLSLTWVAAELAAGAAGAAVYRVMRWEDFGPRSVAVALTGFEPGLASRCLSELLGTFLLVLTVGLNITLASPAAAWSAAAALMCMTYSLGNVSGAHFNPAVTLAVVLRGRCSAGDGLAYVVAQLTAGLLGGIAYGSFHAAGPNQGLTYPLGPGPAYGPATAGAAELLFTFVLAYTVLACSTITRPASWRTKQNAYFGLAIGACAAVGGLAAGSASGGELNPAVCLGITTANLYHRGLGPPPPSPLPTFLAFSTWELAGGLLAAGVFRRTHPGEFRSTPLLGK